MPEVIDRYTYRVFWSEEDQEYVGLCLEFGFLSHLDETPEKALAGIREVVAAAVQLNREDGIPDPEPLSTKRYSGKLSIRIPPESPPRLGDGRRRGRRQPESAGDRTPDSATLED